MNIDKNLIEYGELNLELEEVNTDINEIIQNYRADGMSVQLFDYIDFDKNSYNKISLEKWASSRKEPVHDLTYILLNLVKQKKKLKQKINYRNRNIINYGIGMYKEKENGR